MSRKTRIAVLGAGISGLATAREILEEFRNSVEVIIFAEEFVPDITSSMAAGFWCPHALSNTPEYLQRRWGKKTFDYLHSLDNTGNASETGIIPVFGYFLYLEEAQIPPWSDIVFGFRRMTQQEIEKFPGHKMGFAFTTYISEPLLYIPWITDKIKSLGGKLVQRRVDSLSELLKDFDIVVNCCGIGGRNLGYNEVYPGRGQIMRVEAPWVKNFVVSFQRNHYIMPLRREVVLGGTNQNDMSKAISLEDTQHIWNGCCHLLPSLKRSKVVYQGVGHRPMRETVRVELEKVKHNGRTRYIVHNYGHGGSGFTIHKGCALEALDLLKQALAQLSTSRL